MKLAGSLAYTMFCFLGTGFVSILYTCKLSVFAGSSAIRGIRVPDTGQLKQETGCYRPREEDFTFCLRENANDTSDEEGNRKFVVKKKRKEKRTEEIMAVPAILNYRHISKIPPRLL